MSLLQNSNAISAGGAYNITDSLRFRSSAGAYLERTFGVPTDPKKYTISVWVKRGALGVRQDIISAFDGVTTYPGAIIFLADDTLGCYMGGASANAIVTTQLFRDPSAWYHIVFSVDAVNTTCSLQINGGVATTATIANVVSQINANGRTVRIGDYFNGVNPFHFDGHMTEFNFVDGQALTASDFGETNADGVWSPKEYTGTYGTNGFYLPMKETTQATGFNTVLWTGNGTSQSITGVGFSPDFVWLKERTSTSSNFLNQAVDGTVRVMQSNATIAELVDSQLVGSFNSDGFSVGNSGGSNQSGQTYVAWCWDAGSSTVSNTDGTITSSVRANPATGFSIVTYTGTGTNGATFGHGLGIAPKFIIIKDRTSGTQNWGVFNTISGSIQRLRLNDTLAALSNDQINSISNSVIDLKINNEVNASGDTYVAYCFSEVAGFSKFGSYTGNGSTSGPTVTTGFRPAFVMFKRTDSASNWLMIDSTRTTYLDKHIHPNLSNAEATASVPWATFSDTGFTLTSAFGETNASGGNYIYMAFADTRDFNFSFDASGNKNNWTPNNINSNASSEPTYDLMSDSPSLADEDTGNFATLNPLHRGTASFAKNSNLTYYSDTSTSYSIMGCSIAVSSGKWYWELKCISGATPTVTGIMGSSVSNSSLNTYLANLSTGYVYVANGYKGNNNVQVPYGDTFTYGDTLGVALDLDNGAIYFSKNGTWQNSGDPTSGATATGAAYTGLSGEFVPAVSDHGGAGATEGDINFGQRPFKYTPPTGYKKLNTFNLPDSSITDGSDYFNTVTYTGNGSTNAITTSFSPDLVWLKNRGSAQDNTLFDSLRGTEYFLITNWNGPESTDGNSNHIAYNSDGFTLTGSNARTNASSNSYVAWNWRGSDSTAVSNTDGTITSTVSANPTSGFSVVTYTGNGTSAGTVGHGLGVAPKVVIAKSRDGARNWAVYHASLGINYLTELNTTSAVINIANYWGSTSPTSEIFGVYTGNNFGNNNYLNEAMVAYCFAEVEGFSKFSSYTGNGSTDGPMVYCGFKPAFIMVKATNVSGTSWVMHDIQRQSYNILASELIANSSAAETSSARFDILSNGFKLRTSANSVNGSYNYIFMAFASNPFKNSLGQ